MIRTLLLAALVVATLPAAAQGLKVGYTDYEVLLSNMPQMAQVQQTLQQEAARTQQRLQQQAAELQAEGDRFQRQARLLSEDARGQRQRQLDTLQAQLQFDAQQADQRLAARQAELMRPLYEALQGAVDAIAQEKGLDLVLATQAGGQPTILYVNPETIVNITREVAVRLGIPVEDDAGVPGTPTGN